MTTYAVVRRKKSAIPSVFAQVALALSAGVLLFLFLALVGVIAFDLLYAGRIYPGVSIAGVDLSGKTAEQAQALLAERLTYVQTGKLVIQDGEKVWIARPADLGLSFDPAANAQAAYRLGRSGNPFARLADQMSAWHSGQALSPHLVYDERLAQMYLNDLAAQVNQPVSEASLSINGLDVVVLPGQVGRRVDVEASLPLVEAQLRTLTDGVLPLVVEESQPAILDASQQAEVARGILSAPLVLQISGGGAGDPGPWAIPPDQLAEMLTIQRVESEQGWRYQVGLEQEALTTYLAALAADIDRYPENARFIFNDETRLLEVIQPAVIGRTLDVAASVQEINQKIIEGQHAVPLTISTNTPDITDAAVGSDLGITEQVIAYTTYFRGSSTERLQNIELAAANFHGLLVPPGAVFSMASAMGNVSLDTGYAEAWIIFGGRTIKGVGGGVCQVSTTLFRTAFFSGYPIIERYPHAYRVGYYEQTGNGYDSDLAGLDATVFVPSVDFKFQNDTPYWLLMETYFNPTRRSLTWKFYSTSDGRSVDWETSGPQNIVEPPDEVYEENPDLPQGEIKQVDWAAEGADVTVTRRVIRDGLVLYSDQFVTHYMPWADVYQYGPGTKLPEPYKKKNKNTSLLDPMLVIAAWLSQTYQDLPLVD